MADMLVVVMMMMIMMMMIVSDYYRLNNIPYLESVCFIFI